MAAVTQELGQRIKTSSDGVCLSASSAASHEACRAADGDACRAGESCMQPVLAEDEHLYKVWICHWPVFSLSLLLYYKYHCNAI